MAIADMERISHLEGAYEHMASKAELATLNGDYKVQFARIEHQFELMNRTMGAMQDLLVQIVERLDRLEVRMDRVEARLDRVEARLDSLEARMDGLEARMDRVETVLESIDTTSARIFGYQTRTRDLRDEGAEFESDS